MIFVFDSKDCLKEILRFNTICSMAVIKIILKTFLGLLVLSGGLYLAYYYVSNLETVNPLILVLSLVIIIAGIIFLIRVGKSGETLMVDFQEENLKHTQLKSESKENFLERNAKISAEWTRTVEKKDKLKTLEIAAAAEEEPSD
jgi:hypothetical protein